MKQYKFSIITPSHRYSSYLDELYESLVNQTYNNWEWILYLNNSFTKDQVPFRIKEDKRVKIYYDGSCNKKVGYNKLKAFSLGTGDILVEVDHDDYILEYCLEQLNNAFQDESIGFVYSDNATWHINDESVPFSADHGWTHRTFNWNGKNLYAMDFFEATSQSLSFIWYAPDHVRAWRKEIYHEVGGHNPDREICDDHELLVLTYLKTKFYKIKDVLYIYRITGNNTSFVENVNSDIQNQTRAIFNQYALKLAERDAELKGLLKVDMGGGINPLSGYLVIDQEGGDINCDLNDGIPLPDNSVGVLHASHVIEHLKDPLKTMSEIHRVLAHGGWAFIEVPSTDGRGAFQDPTHVSFWNENSFLYYTNRNLAYFIRNDKIRFQSYRCETWFPNEYLRSLNVPVVTAWLVAIKDDSKRFPGELNI
jgi:glycosyltransferase involved in cell wall biosynthesis